MEGLIWFGRGLGRVLVGVK